MSHPFRTTVLLTTAMAGTIALYSWATAGDETPKPTDEPPAPTKLRLTEPAPQPDKPAPAAPAEVLPSPLPGWVQKEVQIRIPVMVPEHLAKSTAPEQPVPPPLPVMPWPAFPVPTWSPPPFPVPPLSAFPAPPALPGWTRDGFWMPPVVSFPAFALAPAPVDEGSLQTQEQELPDGQGGHLSVRIRTWTSKGVPCREVTVLNSAGQPQRPAAEVESQSVKPAEAPTVKGPDASGKPQKPTAPEQPAQPAAKSIPAPAFPATGTQVYHYQRGDGTAAGISTRVQAQPGERKLVGVGVSVDPQHGTRIYRYGDSTQP